MGSRLFCLAGWVFHKQGRPWQANKYVICLCHSLQSSSTCKCVGVSPTLPVATEERMGNWEKYLWSHTFFLQERGDSEFCVTGKSQSQTINVGASFLADPRGLLLHLPTCFHVHVDVHQDNSFFWLCYIKRNLRSRNFFVQPISFLISLSSQILYLFTGLTT